MSSFTNIYAVCNAILTCEHQDLSLIHTNKITWAVVKIKGEQPGGRLCKINPQDGTCYLCRRCHRQTNQPQLLWQRTICIRWRWRALEESGGKREAGREPLAKERCAALLLFEAKMPWPQSEFHRSTHSGLFPINGGARETWCHCTCTHPSLRCFLRN